ncbi:YkgJ family cysteine cluster protein [Polyangium sp. 6x1]|uniref:YkgJ family cysteine cluster protein n=1 Tax=Polyangium sp. 6x1 TaxID=3042689 RepID=UPI002482684A|nr:YkgJ family cysteine cluster protein [Polyangium sp. 6x1]MDI1449978.1 YkgJ family cysteine cluster protein [Polyangium sp. 6x1]
MTDERRSLPLARPSRYSPEVYVGVAEGESQALAPLVAESPERAIEAAGIASERAASLTAAAHAHEPPDAPIACRRGCSTCCHAKVLVVAPEVLRIAAHLRATRSPEDLADLLARVQAADVRVRGLSRAARAEARVPCPLLDADGGCGVHPVRPLVCRSWTSYDAGACERYWEAPAGKQTPPQWAIGYELAQAVLAGLGKACFDVGRDGTPLELIAALRITLERPTAGERWHKRLPVFSAAKDAEWIEANVPSGPSGKTVP